MGKHSEWRKLAKKLRRKRLRQQTAKNREQLENEEQRKRETSPTYINYLKEQKELEEFQRAEEEKNHAEQEKLYQEREQLAQIQWLSLQDRLKSAQEERAKQNAKIKEEWDKEQARLKALKEEKEKREEEIRLREQKLQSQIDKFIYDGEEMPEELKSVIETNPGKVICQFYLRTAACRFGDMCSRNHIKPIISKVLLIKNFYHHYSLDSVETEHGDSSLEFENQEIYKHFKDFFNDVVQEFEKFGVVRQFKVCCNKEPHLRGNVYVEYSNLREAMTSYRRFCGRFYAGKQLNVQFCTIDSWRSAICGLFFSKRCPKGSVCNFLHVFRNPNNLFMKADKDFYREPTPSFDDRHFNNSERRNWRWSESPEIIFTEEDTEELEKETKTNDKSKSHRKHSKHHRNRSQERSSSIENHKKTKRKRSRSRGHRHKSKRSKIQNDREYRK